MDWGCGARCGDSSNGAGLVDWVLSQELGANVTSDCQADQALGLLIHLAPDLEISTLVVGWSIGVDWVLGLQGLVERVGKLVE
jgi:hypothetical protein